jgi:Mrp family chromosome partitioning ATPase
MQPSQSPLRQYIQTVRRQAWIVLLVPAVTVGAMLAFVAAQKPVYAASTTLVVGEPRGDQPPVLGSGSVTRTMTNLLESDLVARSVIRKLRLDVSTDEFGQDLLVEVLPDTSVLDVKYLSTDRKLALAIVAEIARTFTRAVDETLGVQSGRRRSGSFNLVVRNFDTPHAEELPTSPVAKLVFAGIVGLALGLMLAIAREALDSRLRGSADAETWFQAPVVGALPKGMRGKSPPGVGTARRRRSDSRRVASLDLIRARLQFAQMGIGGPTIVVTSAGPGDGKSTVVANLGAALAWAGKRVICVDADVRRPALHRYLGLQDGAPGLVDVLKADVVLEDALVPVDLVRPALNGSGPAEASGQLAVLPAGSAPSAAVGVLTPEVVAAVIERLHRRADYVVFDSPSLLVADAFPLALQSDNVIVVARQGRTTQNQAEAVRTTLEGLGVQKVGVVLTDAASAEAYA